MRKHIFSFFLIIVIVFAGCRQQNAELTGTELKEEREAVALVLEKYVIANERQEIALVHEIWAPDDDIVVFGTTSDEKLVGWDAIQEVLMRQFNTFENTYITVRDQNIKVNSRGCTAWFSEILNYNYIYRGEAKAYEGLRFTGILEKRDGEWRIVQSHMSVPAGE
ncbi:MAG: nuclear transport factor 2 family protein [Bacteroidales bacterium]|nr:nuclear transport factor 2 family protein [Bacteroidales bacterium]